MIDDLYTTAWILVPVKVLIKNGTGEVSSVAHPSLDKLQELRDKYGAFSTEEKAIEAMEQGVPI